MQIEQVSKERRFFEYLLELNKLTGKVIRNYKDYEMNWDEKELKRINDCYVGNECKDIDTFLEVHKPKISREEKIPPTPDSLIKGWVNFDIKNENAYPKYVAIQRNQHDEKVSENFEDNKDRIKAYKNYINEWEKWAKNLIQKKRADKLYNYFFDLVSRFEREGESLEFLFGRGILTWNHPDKKIGVISSPLITQQLEFSLNAVKGIITASRIEKVNTIEREMLSGVRLPNRGKVDSILSNLKTIDIKDDISDLLTQFIHTIDSNGKYRGSAKTVDFYDNPVVYDNNIFILRAKHTRILRDDLENIITQIDSGNIEINDAVNSILGNNIKLDQIINTESNSVNSNQLVTNQLFFPLESNEQQREIVKRIELNYGVTVQGPPGTGKTHTIANLVSHFLAKGKRILITSQKESPLKVLKDKIPKDIQDLCVPVLGGGKGSLTEIEKSINTISERLGELDTNTLGKSVDLNLQQLDKSIRIEARLLNQLKDYTEKEGTTLKYKGEELFRYEVAKRLSNIDINYEWILDKLDIEAKFPLSEVEFIELWEHRDLFDADDLKLYTAALPKTNEDILSEGSFKEMIKKGDELAIDRDQGCKQLNNHQLPSDINLIKQCIDDLQKLIEFEGIIQDQGYQSILNDTKAGGLREKRWIDLAKNMETNCKKLFEYYNKLITHSVKLPPKELSELKNDLTIAKERLQSKKKPNNIFFLFKGKQTKYLFNTTILNNKPIAMLEDIEPVENYIAYQELINETARIINGNLNEINHKTINKKEARFPHLLEEKLKKLGKVLEVSKIISKLSQRVSIERVNLYAPDEINRLLKEFNQAKVYLEYQNWIQLYNVELAKVIKFSKKENAHSIIFEFVKAFQDKDISTWTHLQNKLVKLNGIKRDVYRFNVLLNKMNYLLPQTKKSIELSVGTPWDYPINYLESFENKKLRTWLDKTKNVNVSKLRNLIDNEKVNQKKLINNIVTESTWKNQIERITEKEKRALSSWKTYIRRFGKGTGKYAGQHLSNARDAMKDAQSAIPVWIMPITQVLENFPITNEKFDIVIFDESSQCDIFSTNVLLRGKKLIVVGDDQQISPQAIGTKQDDVNELVSRYLPDIPNSNLLDGNISLYEIAEQTFPKEGKLMLREHFRCVPEIIQFSNDLSYGGEMIPLRLPLEEEKLEPPVMTVLIEEGYNEEFEKDINKPEAEAIAKDISKIVMDPTYKDQTIGVITLQGSKQHKLLEILIRDIIGDAEFVSRKIICGNPYDLQGDERDIVFLSMVVAPNRNFRPLTKLSEKQRYNVAASRAKNQMRLYHSVDTRDLNSDDYRYELLSYCKNPTRVNKELESLEELCESPFELDVLKMILAKGYRVTPQVKVGRYRIDFVIEGIRDRLAVECDGEKWHGPEKFEEDMQRQGSLERAGWKFWRIRGREFYFNRKKAMESLWLKLNEMEIQPKTSNSQTTNNIDINIKDAEENNDKDAQNNNEGIKSIILRDSSEETTSDIQQMSIFDK